MLAPASEPGSSQTRIWLPCLSPGLRAARSETTLIWPELQLPLVPLPTVPPAHPSSLSGGTALAGVGNGQVGESVPHILWAREAPQSLLRCGHLVLNISRGARAEEDARPSLSPGPVARGKGLPVPRTRHGMHACFFRG